MCQKPVLPTGRAAVFSAVCVGLAVGAHTWMSGAGVPLWAVLAGLLPVFVTARLAAGRERSLGPILALMGLDQVALHMLFETAQQHAAAAVALVTTSPAAIIVRLPTVPLPGMSSISAVPAVSALPSTFGLGTAVTSMPSMPGMPSMPAMPGMGMPPTSAPMHMTTAMFAAHALAALLCAWWLRRGEATVHELFGTLAAWVADRFHLPSPARPAAITNGPTGPRPRGTEPSRPVTAFLRFVLARRGPPVPLSFCCV